MAQSKKSTQLKPVLISAGAIITLLIIVFAGFKWQSQVNELKENKNLADQKIAELQSQVNSLGSNKSTEEQSEGDAASKFVSDFYNERIQIINAMSNNQESQLDSLEQGKVTTELKSELNQPQESDRFFCVKDPVMSLIGVKITKLETSFRAVITIKVGDENENSEIDVRADLIRSEDSFKFDSLECIY